MTDSEIIRLAEKHHAESGPVCVYLKRGNVTESFTLGYVSLSGKRYLLVKDRHGLPIKLIPAPERVLPAIQVKKAAHEDYMGFAGAVSQNACGAVYPLSIVEGTQKGDIYTLGKNVLFWHKCGFAFLYGEHDKAVLDEVYNRFMSPESAADKRFVLFLEDEATKSYFDGKADITVGRRYFFEYGDSTPPEVGELYEGFSLHKIDETLFDGCTGKITPYFSWDSKEEFLQKGAGFCVTHGDRPVAWAFSASVGGEEIDIGVETLPDYRRLGLAAKAAKAMIAYCLGENKRPVWACSSENEGSRRLAEKVGFVKTAECFTAVRLSR